MEIVVMGVLGALTALAIWNIRNIRNLRAELATAGDASGVSIDMEQFESLMELELQRARRLNYALSIIMFHLERKGGKSPSPNDVLGYIAGDPRYVGVTDESAGVANIFRHAPDPVIRLRSTDTAVYDRRRNRYVMMLVGTQRDDAERIAKRIASNLTEQSGHSVSYGCAEFPRDRYLIDDLIEDAEQHRKAVARSGSGQSVVS